MLRDCMRLISDYHLVGGLEHFLLSISYMGCRPSHWLITPSFFRGVRAKNHQPAMACCVPLGSYTPKGPSRQPSGFPRGAFVGLPLMNSPILWSKIPSGYWTVRHGFSMAHRNRWFTVLNSMVDLSMANCNSHNQTVYAISSRAGTVS